AAAPPAGAVGRTGCRRVCRFLAFRATQRVYREDRQAISGTACRTLKVNLAGNACLLLNWGHSFQDVGYDIWCPSPHPNATCGLCQGQRAYFSGRLMNEEEAPALPLADNRFVLASQVPWYCVECGVQLEPGHRFCWRCGTPRWTPSEAAPAPSAPTPPGPAPTTKGL